MLRKNLPLYTIHHRNSLPIITLHTSRVIHNKESQRSFANVLNEVVLQCVGPVLRKQVLLRSTLILQRR